MKPIRIREFCDRCKNHRSVHVDGEGRANAYLALKKCDDHKRCAGELHELAKAEGARNVERMRAAEAKRARKRARRAQDSEARP